MLQAHLQAHAGIQVNLGKTRAWSAGGVLLPGVEAFGSAGDPNWVGDPSLPPDKQGLVVLGSPLGSLSFTQMLLAEKRAAQDALPMTRPHTRPFGFCKATMRPLKDLSRDIGTCESPHGSCQEGSAFFIIQQDAVMLAVAPDGPGAAPRRALRKLEAGRLDPQVARASRVRAVGARGHEGFQSAASGSAASGTKHTTRHLSRGIRRPRGPTKELHGKVPTKNLARQRCSGSSCKSTWSNRARAARTRGGLPRSGMRDKPVGGPLAGELGAGVMPCAGLRGQRLFF